MYFFLINSAKITDFYNVYEVRLLEEWYDMK